MVVCKDIKAYHPSWSLSGKTREGKFLSTLIKTLQRRENRASDSEAQKKLPSSRGRQQRQALCTLTAPHGITHPLPGKGWQYVGVNNRTHATIAVERQDAIHPGHPHVPGGVRKRPTSESNADQTAPSSERQGKESVPSYAPLHECRSNAKLCTVVQRPAAKTGS